MYHDEVSTQHTDEAQLRGSGSGQGLTCRLTGIIGGDYIACHAGSGASSSYIIPDEMRIDPLANGRGNSIRLDAGLSGTRGFIPG